jgi:signal transduction histidine kinase/CheY-like chemotaxis protein
MNDPLPAIAEQYASAFQDYLAEAGEAGLQRAYEVGHHAMTSGVRMLDLAAVHHEALVMVLLRARTPEERARTATAAASFFQESLSPFEMTHRGFLEANATLRLLNQTLEQRVQELQSARATAETAAWRSRFLAEASRELAAALDYRARLAIVARLAVPYLADYCIIDEVEENGEVRRVEVTAADPAKQEFARDLQRRTPLPGLPPIGGGHPPRSGGRAPAEGGWGEARRGVLRTGQSEIWPDVSPSQLEALALDDEYLPLLQKLGIRSVMIVSLQARGRTLAVMTFLAAESGRRYGPDDLALAADFADRAAVALDNARLYHEVQDAAQRKDEFLAMLAHELRNPLAPILNAMQVIQIRGTDDPALQRAGDVVQRQGRHMARLLDDLLDVSRITHGKIELRKEPVDLAAVVENALQTSRPFIEAGQHEVSICLPPEPLRVEADPTRLEQVITNLLNNAAKYTESGGCIWVTAQREGDDAVVRVRDTGVGISPALLPHVFDLFTQASRPLDRPQGGLGIGLTLVRRLVELHGGSVEADSAGPGRGSEFVVHLPASPEARLERPETARRAAPVGERPRRVLLVEDNLDAAQTLAELLESWGHEVRVALDGAAALEAARDASPEVVLLDIGLPGMDGYEVARRLREQAGRAGLLLVAVTGYGQAEDRRCAREAGFDQHLTKPVDLAELEQLLAAAPPGQVRA